VAKTWGIISVAEIARRIMEGTGVGARASIIDNGGAKAEAAGVNATKNVLEMGRDISGSLG
jgi:hypothetical protein